ncbi:MAG: hypothetical protein ACRC6B_06465, partial [Fusobacteriaceae bacterium]
FLEHQVYNTVKGEWYYGTSLARASEDNSIIILDTEGYFKYKEVNPDCTSIFISCVDETERFYKSVKRLKECNMSDIDEVYRRVKADESKFSDIHEKVDYVVPQFYNEHTIELVFSILDKLNFKRRDDKYGEL